MHIIQLDTYAREMMTLNAGEVLKTVYFLFVNKQKKMSFYL